MDADEELIGDEIPDDAADPLPIDAVELQVCASLIVYRRIHVTGPGELDALALGREPDGTDA
jgi:hypothetical protein